MRQAETVGYGRTGTMAPHSHAIPDQASILSWPPHGRGADATIGTVMTCRAKQTLFWEGDSIDYLYKILRGTVCLYKLLPDGRRQVGRFCHAGDLVGMNGSDTHGYTAEALTEVSVTRIRRSDFDKQVDADPVLRRSVMSAMRAELVTAQDQLLLLGRKSALERVATFLMAMSEQAIRQGGDGRAVDLPMTRVDIADYLGLTHETVCRALAQLKKQSVIAVPDPHRIEIRQLDLLEDIAAGDDGSGYLAA